MEQELLELWSSVEKEKAAARERALVARRAGKAQLRRQRGNDKARVQRGVLCLSLRSVAPSGAIHKEVWPCEYILDAVQVARTWVIWP